MAAALIGTEGFWGEPADVISSDAEHHTAATAGVLISPPREWPDCFKSNEALKASPRTSTIHSTPPKATSTAKATDPI